MTAGSLLHPDILLRAYCAGIFPMAESRDDPDVYWVEPKRRGVLPLDGFHLARSLARTLRRGRFTVTIDEDFAGVMRACAEPQPDREDSWISEDIIAAYVQLYRLGHAHSVECRIDGQLVGGLYGVSIARAFFGESMFSRVPDASKVALAYLVARLRAGGYHLLDCQFITPHLASMGAIEISRSSYMSLLGAATSGFGARGAAASAASGDFFALDAVLPPDTDGAAATTVSGPTSGHFIAQLLGQTS